jgi:phenylalanyl-tRNA synthetase beta chain
LSRYPSVRRDLALVLPQQIGFETLRQCVAVHAPDWLQSVNVFDVYSGTGIEPGMKSVALGLILQDFSRTLEESEIDQAIQRILAGLNQDLGVTLRV